MGGKWYKQGLRDALDGIYDPPMWPGKRDHGNYCEGHTDGERQLDRGADAIEDEDDFILPTGN
jgi:hypothetical protein